MLAAPMTHTIPMLLRGSLHVVDPAKRGRVEQLSIIENNKFV